MARGKHAAALFEVIHKSRQERRSLLRTPSWWFRRRTTEEPAPAAAPQEPATQPTEPVALPAPVAQSPPIPSTDAQDGEPQRPARSWWGGPGAFRLQTDDRQINVRMSYAAGAVFGLSLLLLMALSYLGGRYSHGPAPALAGPSTEQIRQGPPQPAVLDLSRSGASQDGTVASGAAPTAPVAPEQPRPQPPAGVVRDANRQIGLNYVISQSYPNQQQAREAVQVLAEHGVGATVEQGLRGFRSDWHIVVGIDGFERIRSPEYERYVQRIHQISSQHSGRRSFRSFEPMGYKWDRR